MKFSYDDIVNNNGYEDKEYEEKRKYIKKKSKYIRFCLSILLSSLLIGIGSNARLFFDTNDNIYDKNDNLISSDEDIDLMLNELSSELNMNLSHDDLDYLMLYSVLSNNNLSRENKEKIYNLSKLINNNQFIDKDKAYRDLANLKIKYTNRDDKLDSSISGRYNYLNNTIEIYEDNYSNDVLYHELIHCLFNNENTKDLPNFFAEGTTELLENEFFSPSSYLEENSYIYEVILVKTLCELVGSNNVLIAYSTGNINYVTNELCNNSSYNLSDVNKIFNDIDNLFKEDNIDKESFNNAISLLNEVYNSKINDSNFDKVNCKYLINLLNGIASESKYVTYFYNLEKMGASSKLYFNKNTSSYNYSYVPYKYDLDKIKNKVYYKN